MYGRNMQQKINERVEFTCCVCVDCTVSNIVFLDDVVRSSGICCKFSAGSFKVFKRWSGCNSKKVICR
jgi:hypothetical protein